MGAMQWKEGPPQHQAPSEDRDALASTESLQRTPLPPEEGLVSDWASFPPCVFPGPLIPGHGNRWSMKNVFGLQ